MKYSIRRGWAESTHKTPKTRVLGLGYGCSGQRFRDLAASLARRAIMKKAAVRHGAAIALAHHADNQAETVLFRLARGAAGPRGMDAVTRAEGCIWLRPLLECTRS